LFHHKKASAEADPDYGPNTGNYLLCHYCGYHEPLPEVCPTCHGVRCFPSFVGTEQVEQRIIKHFPEARVLRMDSDNVTDYEQWWKNYNLILNGNIDIIIGTQMITKGHDFPGVTFVGVLLADQNLSIPDFRAGEKTFRVLTQVVGRAGRGGTRGKAIIQAFNIEHHAIKLASLQDFNEFYNTELPWRESLLYPPFFRITNIVFSGLDKKRVQSASQKVAGISKRLSKRTSFSNKVFVLGPVTAPIARIRGKWRWLMMIKASTPQVMTDFLRLLTEAVKKNDLGPVDFFLDRDPLGML